MKESLEDKILKIPILKYLIIIPKQIKLPGLKGFSLYDLLKAYFHGIIQGTFSSRAGYIAYSFFMAIFPFALFLLSLIPFLPINLQDLFNFIEDVLPAQATEFFLPTLKDIAENPRGGLLSFAFILTIFLMTNGVNAIFNGFENSYYVTINRPFFKQYSVALVISVVLGLLFLLSVVLFVYSEFLIDLLERGDIINDNLWWIKATRYMISVVLTYLMVAMLYHFGIKEGKDIRFFSVGAAITTLLFMITTYYFGVYIDNFSSYNKLYGSIGALLVMMTYIWINSNLLLLGFDLNTTIKSLKEKHE